MADHIGLIGLGVMGRNLALNIADNGYRVAVFNRTPEVTQRFVEDNPAQGDHLVARASLAELVEALPTPRAILLMVQAGAAVDEQIAALTPLLSPGDIVMDGGNANYRDTQRRATALDTMGLNFLGVGVSGGEEGARHGPSIMIGGSTEGFAPVAKIFRDIAAVADHTPCCARLGNDGAGHFVKTMHNGIEYADMQMIAEAHFVLRQGLQQTADQTARVFNGWRDGALSSYLIDITADIVATVDPDTGNPMVDMILDRAGEKGTGRWASAEALDLGVPAPTITEAVAARALSALKDDRVAAAQRYAGISIPAGDSDTDAIITALEGALLAGKIAAYAQGFAVLAAASRRWDWQLPMSEIARIWRAGCIIRSQFLDDIAAAFASDEELPNLLDAPYFTDLMTNHQADLRNVVVFATQAGLPIPCLSSALAYFDAYRHGRLWADLIQAQRDYFGAHTFERTDRPGSFHFDWIAAARR